LRPLPNWKQAWSDFYELRNVSRLLTLPGDITPIQEATLDAKVSGYVSDIKVDKGDRVRANESLAVISAPELDAERSQAMQPQNY
jgi:multidrug efflux pump subunit AcrA (membrane-fusion protein)